MAFDVIFQPRADADIDVVVAWLTRNKYASAAARWRAGLFSVDGDTVNVHRIRHAAQDRLKPCDA